jgi:uncharacterized metal-binding protein
MAEKKATFTCGECTTINCSKQTAHYPDNCPTENTDREELADIIRIYKEDPIDAAYSLAAAETVKAGYGKLSRVEEIAAFAENLGARKIGIAACVGLAKEAKLFISYLESRGLETYSVFCKVGAIEKCEIGLPESVRMKPGAHESICNPVLQARILEREETDLNVIIGLCVGHDSLFIKHSAAPVTYLIVKDRVHGHNPAAGLAALHAQS